MEALTGHRTRTPDADTAAGPSREATRLGTAPDVHSAGMSVDVFLPRGDRYRTTLHGTRDTGFRGALLVYRPE